MRSLPWALRRCDPPAVLADLVYASGPTPLIQWADAGGARTVEGVEVLVRQGARSLAAVDRARTATRASMRRAAESG